MLVGDGVDVTVGVFVRGDLGVFVGVRVAVGGKDVTVLVAVDEATLSVALAGEVLVTPFAVVKAPAGMVLI